MLLKKHHLLSIGKLRLGNWNPSCQGRSIKFRRMVKVKIQKGTRDRVRGISWEYIRGGLLVRQELGEGNESTCMSIASRKMAVKRVERKVCHYD